MSFTPPLPTHPCRLWDPGALAARKPQYLLSALLWLEQKGVPMHPTLG